VHRHTYRQLLLCCVLFAPLLALKARGETGLNELGQRVSSLLFQVSTLDALSLGQYQGTYPVGALKQKGDFGLGTFEGIDGELTVLDGHFYHFRSDGVVTEEPDKSRLPFAVITKFRSQLCFPAGSLSMDDLGRELDRHIKSVNLFYAIRIHGRFAELTTRAIPKLYPPYPSLADATEQEVRFPHQNIKGTLVAFRCPAWVRGINQVGYHYHFISDDGTVGGHALSFTTEAVNIEIEQIQKNSVWVPDHGPFLTAPLPVTQ
jgi:acetolactate decarboxylase